MYAIIEISGKQVKVAEKDRIMVNRMAGDPQTTVTLDKVLLVSDGKKKISVGQPYVEGAQVEAELVKQAKGDKVTIFKYLRRKDSHKKTGHRQALTELVIKKISVK